mmetsp:Transcript_17299/g.25752  ORF Transcript_17299/g.25752 Transcript_17299/m.25752 type:complete len:130 (+) Transcript_17299:142-531(+)
MPTIQEVTGTLHARENNKITFSAFSQNSEAEEKDIMHTSTIDRLNQLFGIMTREERGGHYDVSATSPTASAAFGAFSSLTICTDFSTGVSPDKSLSSPVTVGGSFFLGATTANGLTPGLDPEPNNGVVN